MGKEIELNDEERQRVECWTRVMGYFRPISHFNESKKSEFANRKWFIEKRIKEPSKFSDMKRTREWQN